MWSLVFDNILTLLFMLLCYIISSIYFEFFLTYKSIKKKWYAVYIGRRPGVYDEWSECPAQVNRFRGTMFKGFQSKSEAEASYLRFTVLDVERNKIGLKYYLLFSFFFITMGFILYRKIL